MVEKGSALLEIKGAAFLCGIRSGGIGASHQREIPSLSDKSHKHHKA